MVSAKATILAVLTTVVLAVWIPHVKTSTESLKTYNEPCDGDCDERKGLTCSSNNVCVCMNQNATLYDRTRQLCVTKAGHPCRRLSGGYDALCVFHASCPSPGSLCECHVNYFQTRNGTCLPVAKYGEPCSGKKPCDKNAGMECTASTVHAKGFSCQCKYPKDQFYSKETLKCISYEGGNCSFSLPCVPHASCSLDIFELRKGETPQGKMYTYNATVGRKCVCDEGFKGTKDRRCLPTFLSSCGGRNSSNDEESQTCNPEEGLKCYNKEMCLCGNPLGEEYSSKDSQCLSLVGSSCSEGSSNKCVPNASCSQETSLCECDEGFTGTPGRKCLKDFGQQCSSSNDCNTFRGLHCDGQTCSCLDGGLEYNQAKRKCLGRRGSLCGYLSLDKKTGKISTYEKTTPTATEVLKVNVECAERFTCSNAEFPSISRCM